MRNNSYSSHGLAVLALLVLQLTFATSAFARLANNASSKRVVYYYQSEQISLLPLVQNKSNLNKNGKPYTTDVNIGAFHLGPESDNTSIHLGDLPPSNATFDTLWNETKILQSHGVNIILFLGGAGDNGFINLAQNFSFFYPVLKETLITYKFNGIDLDCEDEVTTTAQIERLIRQLRHDFGKHFVITLAPVTTDLEGEGGLSQIDYSQLYTDVGDKISWFNVQFYSGFGSLQDTTDYNTCVNNSFPANVVVAGMLSNPQNGGGYVNVTVVYQTVQALVTQFPDFGGVATWEYFDALPGGTADPGQWATYFSQAMGL